MSQSFVLSLIPGLAKTAGAMLPAVIGGYATFAEAKAAGDVAVRYPPNLSDEEYAAFHESAARAGQQSSRPEGHPPAWSDYTVVPGSATAAPARETLTLKRT